MSFLVSFVPWRVGLCVNVFLRLFIIESENVFGRTFLGRLALMSISKLMSYVYF